jgi:hypothetical protein
MCAVSSSVQCSEVGCDDGVTLSDHSNRQTNAPGVSSVGSHERTCVSALPAMYSAVQFVDGATLTKVWQKTDY